MRRITLATALAASALALPATQSIAAAVPPLPQGYPIDNLYQSCTADEAHQAGYPDWHYGETARRYLSDGTLQFTNTTDQAVDYSATVETGTNHEIKANSKASLPSGWNTTAKADIGLALSNGWTEGETIGPINLKPGESFRVEYGVLEKDFISMFVDCQRGFYENQPGANVIRGTAPAERYAFAYVIHADGSVSDKALEIPSRAAGANSKVIEGDYSTIDGPSLEKVADPKVDKVITPATEPTRDPAWPNEGDKCEAGDKMWYPLNITGVSPTFRKPGYSQDFMNWTKGPYTFTPVTDHIVGAEYNGGMNWHGNAERLPEGWLESIGSAQRAYLPVGTALKPLDLQPGDKVRVEYGTDMTRVNYSELTCGNDGTYSLVHEFKQATAPAGFWAEATVTHADGGVDKVDVTPEEWDNLPVPTQTNY